MKIQTGNKRLDLSIELRAIHSALADLIEEAKHSCTAATQVQLVRASVTLEAVSIELE